MLGPPTSQVLKLHYKNNALKGRQHCLLKQAAHQKLIKKTLVHEWCRRVMHIHSGQGKTPAKLDLRCKMAPCHASCLRPTETTAPAMIFLSRSRACMAVMAEPSAITRACSSC